MLHMKYVSFALLIITLLLCCLPAVSQTQEDKFMLKPEDFAILPWGWTPGDPNALKEIKACGFNLAGFVLPENLDKVKDAGLKCIVMGENTHVGNAEATLDQAEIDKRVEALVKRVGKHPATYGYYLRDEPGAGVYPGLAKWVEAYRRYAPEALAYINLFPNYASPGQMNVPTYEDYLEEFIKTVKPKFISYDHYALMDDGTLRGGYFQNLESVRKAALKHNLPFWNIVLSNSHFHYAEPTEAGFRFQLYTTLAYGARGISYFTYFAPAVGNYRLAPIDQFGHKTPTWDMLRSVNLQLQRLAPTYIKLKSVNVFHHPEVPEGCAGIQTSRYVTSIEGGNFVVGEFDGPDNQKYVMIVNKDLHNSAAFDIKFKEAGQVQKVSQYSGNVEPIGGEDWWLAAGQGVLFVIKK